MSRGLGDVYKRQAKRTETNVKADVKKNKHTSYKRVKDDKGTGARVLEELFMGCGPSDSGKWQNNGWIGEVLSPERLHSFASFP